MFGTRTTRLMVGLSNHSLSCYDLCSCAHTGGTRHGLGKAETPHLLCLPPFSPSSHLPHKHNGRASAASHATAHLAPLTLAVSAVPNDTVLQPVLPGMPAPTHHPLLPPSGWRRGVPSFLLPTLRTLLTLPHCTWPPHSTTTCLFHHPASYLHPPTPPPRFRLPSGLLLRDSRHDLHLVSLIPCAPSGNSCCCSKPSA